MKEICVDEVEMLLGCLEIGENIGMLLRLLKIDEGHSTKYFTVIHSRARMCREVGYTSRKLPGMTLGDISGNPARSIISCCKIRTRIPVGLPSAAILYLRLLSPL
jgi:hypothetical protein